MTDRNGIDIVYRLGGDEFTVIVERPEAEVKKCLERMEKICADWKGQFISGISISYGSASTEEFSDLDSLLKAADLRMYENKSNYYDKCRCQCRNIEGSAWKQTGSIKRNPERTVQHTDK